MSQHVHEHGNWQEQSDSPHVSPYYQPEIRRISMDQPVKWLRQGWNDLVRHPGAALGYGLFVTALYTALVSLAVASKFYIVGLQATAGFVFLAPLLAVGFYGISKQREKNQPVSLRNTWQAWGANPAGIFGMGAILLLIFMAWFMLSMQSAALMTNSAEGAAFSVMTASFTQFATVILTQATPLTLLSYFAIGLVAVLVTFALAAFSLPMLMDRPETDAITALVTSWHAVLQNWQPMLFWAVLISLITGIGLALFYVGLIVTMPLLGFATWHAYRATLGEWRKVEQKEVPRY